MDNSNHELILHQLRVIFEMLDTLIDKSQYDFSGCGVMFPKALTTDEYHQMVDANFKADYPK